MRTNLDFSPFYRSSIGFDRIFNLLENASPPQNADTWPPYDIAKLGEATALSSRSPVSVKARLRSRRSQICS